MVSLDADLTVTVDSGTTWTNAFGGNNTESVTILGNGHTITFYQQNSDWNHVATNGAKLIINNATIDNSGYNDGPWNKHDIVFDCEVELNNVISKKAIALTKNGELNNVTIEDDAADDVYYLWIQANGQTVSLNNCVINATHGTTGTHRAIAIKDEYVDTTCKKVTLNVSNTKIASQKKAAILVTSKAGATINLSNVNISGTSDTNNAVWIDNGNDYKNVSDTTVTGGNCIIEPGTQSFL